LRYYFGIDKLEENEDKAQAKSDIVAPQNFNARLLGSDTYGSAGAAIHGFVLDEQGQGISQILVALRAGGKEIAQLPTGNNGQFDFNNIATQLGDNWQISLADYPAADTIELSLDGGTRYFVEFQAMETGDVPR